MCSTTISNVCAEVVRLPILTLQLRFGRDIVDVRIVSLIVLSIFAFQARAANPVFGTWRLNAARSTFAGDIQPKSLALRIEPHAGGQSTRIVRRPGEHPSELLLEITDRYLDDAHYERRLVLERQ
jgi:hypothetical protein